MIIVKTVTTLAKNKIHIENNHVVIRDHHYQKKEMQNDHILISDHYYQKRI